RARYQGSRRSVRLAVGLRLRTGRGLRSARRVGRVGKRLRGRLRLRHSHNHYSSTTWFRSLSTRGPVAASTLLHQYTMASLRSGLYPAIWRYGIRIVFPGATLLQSGPFTQVAKSSNAAVSRSTMK